MVGLGISLYTVALAIGRGLGRDGAFSAIHTDGASEFIAVCYVVIGVALGAGSCVYVWLRHDLAPMRYIAAYLLAFASLAWFREEPSIVTNVANCLRYLSISVVASGAWLYQLRGVRRRAYQ
ncbi:hypothetical protein ACFVXC_06045 [Streptomyces sp. NPDC058257]|uniref:hypothetical protein n=1 Tax=Streptomyces sp. NPDC058257 TaxID=3346409 RepID=UPI0036E15677